MQLGIVSLLGTVMSWQNPLRKRRNMPGRHRRLLGERLESRFALSTVSGEVTVAEEPLDTSTSGTTTEEPPPATNEAPQIVDFVYIIEGNWCMLEGRVIDDVDPTGLTVTLDGLISALVEVNADDYFSYVFEIDPDTHGSIFATTVDIGGLVSNTASVLL